MLKPTSNIFVRLMAIAVLQTFVLGWIVWDRAALLRNGQEVQLAVVPVDPRDLLRGEYIILRFDISRIDTLNVKTDRDFQSGDPVYVGLEKSQGGQWYAISANHQLPQGASNIVFIKGKIDYTTKGKNSAKVLNIKYGMEKFFIPEGDGPGLEDLRNEKVLRIVAAVSATGEAGIKALLVRGQPVYEETVF